MKRLFVGLSMEPPAKTEAENLLLHLSEEITHQGLRWVRRDKLHLTLVFLGDVSEEAIPAITERLANIQVGRFSLALTGLGAFPDLRRPRVIWLGVSDSAALRELQQCVVGALSEVITFEDRAFSPHITFGRLSPGSPTVGRLLHTYIEKMGALEAEWGVGHFSLMESTPAGDYEVLHSFPLRDA